VRFEYRFSRDLGHFFGRAGCNDRSRNPWVRLLVGFLLLLLLPAEDAQESRQETTGDTHDGGEKRGGMWELEEVEMGFEAEQWKK
jgi:hypothetical protein